MLLQVILEGLGLGVLLVLVCAVGICKGAVWMVHLYSPAVQQRWPIACGMLRNSTLKRLLRFGIAIKRGWAFLQDRMNKEKKPYIFVGLVCVREKYQGHGYMRKVLDIAFAEGNRLGVPAILETDAKSKCDKYVHLGMELAGTHDLGAFGKPYDLIRYPDPTDELLKEVLS